MVISTPGGSENRFAKGSDRFELQRGVISRSRQVWLKVVPRFAGMPFW